MGLHRYFVGLVVAFVCIAPGCSNLIGLNGYSVGGHGSESTAGSRNDAGSRDPGGDGGLTSAGSAGDSSEDAGESGTSSAGRADSGGSAGTAGVGGSAGPGGAPGSCANGCNDNDDCTNDACATGKCVHQASSPATPCGTGRVCDAGGVCVRCLDTAPGTTGDLGCPATAPVCVGTGAAAICGGCIKAADCADTNDCTTEQCTDSKCVVSPVAPGQMCATGVCNGDPEKCVSCADTATGRARDAGCTTAKPVCDPTGSGTCYACVQDSDCASDNVSCTVETCTNHACAHVATDGKCASSADVCKPNRCDAALDCKQVDISTKQDLMTDDPSVGNGSFENGTDMANAVGWANGGDDAAMIFDCTGGCASSVDTTHDDDGNLVAWFGGTDYAAVDQLDHSLTLPAGTTTLSIQADMNTQTESTATSNIDRFDIFLLDASKVQIGQAVFSTTNVKAQTSAPTWLLNAVNKSLVDVSAQAGKKIFLRLRSSVDAALKTDFFVDNVRVVATVCK